MTLLTDLLPEYIASKPTIKHPATERHYRRALRQFGDYLGHPPRLADLADVTVSAWMQAAVADGLSPVTVNGRAKEIRALWRWAAMQRLTDAWPAFRDLEAPDIACEIWTAAQLQKLFAACERQRQWMGPVPAKTWWLAFHYWLLDSAERIGCTLALDWSMFNPGKQTMAVPASIRRPPGPPMLYRLSDRTCELIESMRHPVRDTIFTHHLSDWRSLYKKYQRIVRQAGLPYRGAKSGPCRMRRTVLACIQAGLTESPTFNAKSPWAWAELEERIDAAIASAVGQGQWPRKDADPLKPRSGFLSRILGKVAL